MFPFVALLALLGITMVTDTSTDSDESDDQPSDGAQPADPVQGDLLRVMMQDSMAAEDTAADPIISDDDTAEKEASDTLEIVRADHLDLLQYELSGGGTGLSDT